MKLNKLYLVLLLIATAVGCSKNTTPSADVVLSDNEIALSPDPSSQLASKGERISEFEQIESIGVFAFYNSSAYITNVQPVQDDDYWVFSPAVNWPESGTVGFVSYSPYISLAESSTSGLSLYSNSYNAVIINYSMPSDVSLHQDLLVASSEGENGDIVNLWFKHPMASVSFKVHADQESELITDYITLSGIYDSGTLTVTSSGFSWNNISSTLSKSFQVGYIDAPEEVAEILVSDANYLMVPPQTVPSETKIHTMLDDGTELDYTLSDTWEAGNNYTYVLYVSNDALEVESVVVTPWEDIEEQETVDYNQTDGESVGTDVEAWEKEDGQNMESAY